MTRISALLLPSVAAAVHSYEQNQGQLTTESQFGSDPLIEREDLVILREQHFLQRYRFEDIFTDSVSGNQRQLVDSICFFKDLTIRYADLI